MAGTFTLKGRFKRNDGTTPYVNSTIHISSSPYPDTTDDTVYSSGFTVVTDGTGAFTTTLVTETSLYYRISSDDHLFDPNPFTFAAPSAGSTLDVTDLTVFDPASITPTIAAQAAASAAAAQAAAASVAASTWQPSVAVVAGQVKQAPDGTTIKRIANGTTRATYDATEIAAWTVLLDTPGTQAQVALAARYYRVIEAPLSPYRYGFVGDGTTDDTTALQNAINAVPAGGAMEFPHSGNAKITAPLNITKAITVRGRGTYSQRLLAAGCDGIRIATGVNDVHLQGFEIAQATRYSTTPNAFVGVTVDGTTASRPTNLRFRDLYMDGFKVGYQTRYLWASLFDNARSDFGLQGVMAYGLSVNNVVDNCAFSTSGGANSKAIGLMGQESVSNATVVASEGWMISNTLTFGAEVGVDIIGNNHIYISNSIIDFNTLYGVRSLSATGAFSNNITLMGSYVAMNGATAAAAVFLANAVSNSQVRYARIADNELVTYSGQTCSYGVIVGGAQALAAIRGNAIQGFSTYDIELQTADNVVTGNTCMSAVTPNIHSTLPNLVSDNVGSVFRTGAATTTSYSRDTLGRKTLRASAAPTTGTWALGDRVINDVPTVGQPKGWVCTVAGPPGTWVSEGNL